MHGSSQSRDPPLLPPAITLSCFPRDTENRVPTLSHILTEILPLHFFLALTLDILNTVNFEPVSKDEEMQSGVLQLPEHSLIIMSENTISEGKLEEKGNVYLLTVDLIMFNSSSYTQRCSQYTGTTEFNSITASLLQFSL